MEQAMKAQRLCATLIVTTIVVSLASWAARAQAPYPTQTIKFIVANPAGGLPDIIARIVGRRLQERLGQPVVIENRPGANAGIGAAALTNAAADGYTFLVTDGAILSINPLLYDKLAYNPNEVFPVAALARAPIFLAAHAKVPVNTMTEFIDYAKAHPGQINYGSSGVGSFHHLSMEAIKAALNLRVTHVPFKGSSESVAALLGGHVELAFSSYTSLSGPVESKQVKLLATNGSQRSPQAPDVPPVADFIPGFDFAVIQGVFARTGTPPAIVRKIAAEMTGIVQEPEVIRQFAVAGIEAAGDGPDDFDRMLKSEKERVAKVVNAAGIKAE
jgi:tripartite-type tricarboxylate transporter receptor subunit TctC